jgi:hypothetical protein
MAESSQGPAKGTGTTWERAAAGQGRPRRLGHRIQKGAPMACIARRGRGDRAPNRPARDGHSRPRPPLVHSGIGGRSPRGLGRDQSSPYRPRVPPPPRHVAHSDWDYHRGVHRRLGRIGECALEPHPAGGSAASGCSLVFASVSIWLTNVIVFGLWYWDLDRGGPAARLHENHRRPDFLFPQMSTPGSGPNWTPDFLDYLYTSFTNATALVLLTRCHSLPGQNS